MSTYSIRGYSPVDYPMLMTWWSKANEPGPTPEMLPEDSTFVLLVNNQPVMCITVYLTNSNYIAYLENFVKNPELKNSKEYSPILVKHAEDFAKSRDVKILVCLSYKDKLKTRYQELGYRNTLNDLSSFAKEI